MSKGGGGSHQQLGIYLQKTMEHELLLMASMKLIMVHYENFMYREWKGDDIICAHKALICMHSAIIILLAMREGVQVISRMEEHRMDKGESNMYG